MDKHCKTPYFVCFFVFVVLVIVFRPSDPKVRIPVTPRIRGPFLKTSRPTFAPTENIRIPFFNFYETVDAYHGDLIGGPENSKEICLQQIENENCEKENPSVFAFLSYTKNYAQDLKIKNLDQYSEIPLYYKDELIALTWDALWSEPDRMTTFFNKLSDSFYLGFRKDEPVALNCDDWSVRFSSGTTSDVWTLKSSFATTTHQTDVPCGASEKKILCVCLSYV